MLKILHVMQCNISLCYNLAITMNSWAYAYIILYLFCTCSRLYAK